MDVLKSVLRSLNRLLPFATAGTPLVQDLLHTLALCTLLYYAPELQRRFEQSRGIQEQLEVEGFDPVDDEDSTAHANDTEPLTPEDGPEPHNEAFHREEPTLRNEPLIAADPEDAVAAEAEAFPPGPANHAPAHRPDSSARAIGAKKAKSLARKDQRRAYHEFMRSQGEAQRAQEAVDAEEREAAIYEEKRRRAVAEQALEADRRREREARREAERKAREEEVRVQKVVLRRVRDGLEREGMVDLRGVVAAMGRLREGGVDVEMAERLLRLDGVLYDGLREGFATLLTESKRVVRIAEDDMRHMYQRVLAEEAFRDGDGLVTFDAFGSVLGDVIRGRASSAV
ncbi:hypothetical protein B0A49_08751 [Cryomyces minteri]|uniref:Uncharacterized protein n=1 Tax=Cryomyces minteri TaxID=331657 RepID=A0A4U0WW46_9PEZI|nr:hypothetical protein B0A49_08751 [Cryomyces minteri]